MAVAPFHQGDMSAMLLPDLERASPVIRIHEDFQYDLSRKGCENNFLKGVRWSPDGQCLLSLSEDNAMRLYEVPSHEQLKSGGSAVASGARACPSLNPALTAREGETVYDFCWYPFMNSSQPSTCFFASTSRDVPIHIWDAFTGRLRASYCAYDDADEPLAALSLAFEPSGQQIFAGYKEQVRVFDLSRPGREVDRRNLLHRRGRKGRKRKEGQRGHISCIDFSSDGLYAAGSYGGTTCVYATDNGELLCEVDGGHSSGVTTVKWSPDGRFLFVGGRKDNYIVCYDIRNAGEVLARFERQCPNNQRMVFDIDPLGGRYLASGCQSGKVLMWDLNSPPDGETKLITPTRQLHGHGDAVTSVSFHPHFSTKAPLLASCSGQRKFGRIQGAGNDMDSGSDSDDEEPQAVDNCVLVWAVEASEAGLEAARQAQAEQQAAAASEAEAHASAAAESAEASKPDGQQQGMAGVAGEQCRPTQTIGEDAAAPMDKS